MSPSLRRKTNQYIFEKRVNSYILRKKVLNLLRAVFVIISVLSNILGSQFGNTLLNYFRDASKITIKPSLPLIKTGSANVTKQISIFNHKTTLISLKFPLSNCHYRNVQGLFNKFVSSLIVEVNY